MCPIWHTCILYAKKRGAADRTGACWRFALEPSSSVSGSYLEKLGEPAGQRGACRHRPLKVLSWAPRSTKE